MDEKISLEAIALYGDTYADKVLKGFFASKEKITGPEILSLCNVHQVNLFVIRELFRAWREETKKLKGSYFDYEHPDVKEALENYTATVSNHISIGPVHFAPLLKKAVSQALMVIFDPYDFYSMLISGKNNKLEVGPFREEIKYLKINKAPLERMLQKLEEKNVVEIPGNEAFAVLDQILEEVNFTPEDLDDYINRFSLVVPLDPGKFYITKTEPEIAPVKEKVAAENKTVTENVPRKENKVMGSTLNDHLVSAQQPALMDNLRKIARIKDSLTI
ncbi:MAG: hypothetical protein ACOYXT_08220, partial [Bacteroidota bacterium]